LSGAVYHNNNIVGSSAVTCVAPLLAPQYPNNNNYNADNDMETKNDTTTDQPTTAPLAQSSAAVAAFANLTYRQLQQHAKSIRRLPGTNSYARLKRDLLIGWIVRQESAEQARKTALEARERAHFAEFVRCAAAVAQEHSIYVTDFARKPLPLMLDPCGGGGERVELGGASAAAATPAAVAASALWFASSTSLDVDTLRWAVATKRAFVLRHPSITAVMGYLHGGAGCGDWEFDFRLEFDVVPGDQWRDDGTFELAWPTAIAEATLMWEPTRVAATWRFHGDVCGAFRRSSAYELLPEIAIIESRLKGL